MPRVGSKYVDNQTMMMPRRCCIIFNFPAHLGYGNIIILKPPMHGNDDNNNNDNGNAGSAVVIEEPFCNSSSGYVM